MNDNQIVKTSLTLYSYSANTDITFNRIMVYIMKNKPEIVEIDRQIAIVGQTNEILMTLNIWQPMLSSYV